MVLTKPVKFSGRRVFLCNLISAYNTKTVVSSFLIKELNPFSAGQVVFTNLYSESFI
ncbi:hypothetical protein LEP1GSC018_1847 [Leptospira kirschneri str. 2008720114]|nr:hypothetical protein LEP1GSC018_1847 [Leptospira kirschneri str. 2008720114]EMK05158.1 hypothetical protein LEP1GSC176_3132 [Leptospira kirschneri str. MMD1493]